MVNLKEVDQAWTRYLRPQTFPVAIRMCESDEELPDRVRIPQRDLGITISLCHAIAMARRYGWSIAVDKYVSCYVAGISMGFLPLLPDILDGSFQKSLEIGMVMGPAAIENLPKFEYGKYKYVLIAPVERATFEPHVILTYASPAQIWVLLGGYLTGTRKAGGLNVTLTTGAGCTNYITRAIQTDEAQFALVGTGERLVPHPQDYECGFSIPMGKIEDTVRGLEAGWRAGISRYPIPTFLRYSSQHPPGYEQMRSHLLGEES